MSNTFKLTKRAAKESNKDARAFCVRHWHEKMKTSEIYHVYRACKNGGMVFFRCKAMP